MDENKVLKASDIMKDPDVVYGFLNQYIIVTDTSMNNTYINLIATINVLGERGWEPITMVDVNGTSKQVMLRNMNYKSKNG